MANPQRENGHVDIANEIVESLARTYLSSYESQTLWAIFRRTYGWHKKEDWLPVSQLVKMTGIHKSHISRTLKKLIQRNMITKKGRKLSFQKNYEKWRKLPRQVTNKKLPKQDRELPRQVTGVTQIGNKKLPKQADSKETKRNLLKETSQKKEKIKDAISKFLKKDPEKEKKKANEIEFDFKLWSWHGIDEDIMDDWEKRFPDINIGEQLMKIREYFKEHPEKEKYIKNYAIYINDWLERASGWKKEQSPCDKPKNENGVCSHLWGSGCDYKCCRDCKEYNCNTRCRLAKRRKE